jgi:Putative Ig domain
VFCVAVTLALAACGEGDPVNGSSTATSSASSSSSTTATPTIKLSGVPGNTVAVGSQYTFQPSVSTSSGTVTFSVTGAPTWASFNSSTGELSGTPTANNVGTTPSITITASDGGATATVGPFSIQVTTSSASASGSATLSWTPPTENTNGTPITDLAGYEIHYGTSADSLTQTIQVVGAATTEYEISNLAEGTYYFTVTAYNSQGIQSAPSSMASTTIG